MAFGAPEKKLWFWGYLAALAPLIPLLKLNSHFYLDWDNHLWQIEYWAEFFRIHRSFPIVLDTTSVVGIAYPPFYGVLFYPLAAIFSLVLGAAVTVRLFCLGLWSLQYFCVFKTSRLFGSSRVESVFISLAVSFAIYPLTNLYNRGALTEFFATLLLIPVASCWFYFCGSEDKFQKVRMILFGGGLLTLAAGFHPITAVFGVFSFCVIAVTTIVFTETKNNLRPTYIFTFLITLLFSVAILSPWLWSTFKFGHDLDVMTGPLPRYYPLIDRWGTRLFPLPLDWQSLTRGTAMVSPYLDAQLNGPLLLYFLTTFFYLVQPRGAASLRSKRGGTLVVFSLFFVFTFVISLRRVGIGEWARPLLKYIQIGYRFITYQNLFLLLSVWTLVHLRGKKNRTPAWNPVLIAICLTTASLAVLLKVVHAKAIEKPEASYARVENLPSSFYGVRDYTLPNRLPPAPKFSTSINFSSGQPVFTDLKSALVVRTNVLNFDWNMISIDQRIIPRSEMASAEGFLALNIPSGFHRLSYGVRPDPIWLVLRRVSFAAILIFVTLVIISILPPKILGRR